MTEPSETPAGPPITSTSNFPLRFSVIIVHRNGAELLRQTLTAVANAYDAAQDEVILVDNGSRDESLSVIQKEFPFVRIIANGCNNGFARACNQGMRVARGAFLLFLNNDALLPANALTRFAANFSRYPRAGLIGGQLYGPDGHPQRSAGRAPTVFSEMGLARRHARSTTVPETVYPVETLVGACIAARRATIDEAGPMDEAFFFYYEETEWCVRLRQHGWEVLLDPTIRVTHLKGATTRPLRREAQIEMLRSRLLYYRKVFSPLACYWLTSWRIARLLVNTAFHLLAFFVTAGCHRRFREQAATYGLQVAWLLSGCPERWGLPDKCPSAQQTKC